jgi:hypothetical protein
VVNTFLGFAQNSFEELQAATCRFSKEFSKSREKYEQIGRKRLKSKQNSAYTSYL